ncbi:MAG: ATP-binding domain-containing protein, partial [Flavobacteriales bacterium]|nr:ATP-binding domain-containing protein [Flavobacteriales bacterium]
MNWLDKRRSSMEKFGNWIELKTVVRMPEVIAEMAINFAETFDLGQDIQSDNSYGGLDLFNGYKEYSRWMNIDSNDWLVEIGNVYEYIKQNMESNHPSDIVILVPDSNYGIKCVNYFKQRKVDVNHVFSPQEGEKQYNHKKSFWMGDSRLKISTIHSFKGWEVLNVILFIPDHIMGEKHLFDKLMYVAMTRTKQNLIVLNSNERYREFSDNLS